MAASKTVIANQALGHLGSGKEIANLDTENSAEARALRRFWDQTQDELMRGYSWPFTTRFVDVAVVEEDPTEEWAFSYRYPSDCLYARRILSGSRNDSRQSRVPYRIGQDDSGQLIYCDMDEATLEYSTRADDVVRWPADFVSAFAYKLAAYAAPTITGSDRANLRQLCLELHALAAQQAMASAANEEQPDESPESEFVRARGGSDGAWRDVGPDRG